MWTRTLYFCLVCSDRIFLSKNDHAIITGTGFYYEIILLLISLLDHVEFWCWELTGRGALPRVLFIQAAPGRDVIKCPCLILTMYWTIPFSQSLAHITYSLNVKYIIIQLLSQLPRGYKQTTPNFKTCRLINAKEYDNKIRNMVTCQTIKKS